MKKLTMIACSISISVVFGGFIGAVAHYQREAGYQAGKEARMAELGDLFAPYGYHKIRMAKKDCEAKTGVTCIIYGGFAPDYKVTREEPVNKQGPL